ncbi:hypothetical protein [Kitasatospora sp. NPDC050463]|uniref:hypothetical protein n=1 Tax=Kitasatospora sp. NPDC050463 TaxID=3155786 RepID=UPI0033E20616
MINGQSCRKLLRATYTSGDSAVTVGVAVFDHKPQADAAGQAHKGQVQGLTTPDGIAWCVTPGCANTHTTIGRYGYYTVSGTYRPGGPPRTAPRRPPAPSSPPTPAPACSPAARPPSASDGGGEPIGATPPPAARGLTGAAVLCCAVREMSRTDPVGPARPAAEAGDGDQPEAAKPAAPGSPGRQRAR